MSPKAPRSTADDPFADPLRDRSALHASLKRGTILNGKYEIHGLIGVGGMGAVYRATQLVVDRIVAIKVLQPQSTYDADARARFVREGVALSKLQHPNVLTLHDYGVTESGLCFLVLEYLDGRPLAEELRVPMHPLRAVAIMRSICAALGAAHRAGIVHRDLKPNNVLLVEIDKRNHDFVKLVDFGISKLASQGSDQPLTGANQRLGTPRYMAPEQAIGSAIDHRADIYAAGCLLFEMLVARPVFIEPNQHALLAKHVHQAPPRFSEVRPDLTSELDIDLESIVRTMLAKRPEERFQSADAVESALALWASHVTTEAEMDRTPAFALVRDATLRDLPATRDIRHPADDTHSEEQDPEQTDVEIDDPSIFPSTRTIEGDLHPSASEALLALEDPTQHTPAPNDAEGPHKTRAATPSDRAGPRQRSNRMILAGGLVVILAGGLTILAAIALSTRKNESPIAIAPLPVAERLPIAKSIEPVPSASADPAEAHPVVQRQPRLRAIRVESGAVDAAQVERALRSRERDVAGCFKSTQGDATRTMRLRFMSSEGRLTIWASPKDAAAERFAACVRALKPPLDLPINPARSIHYFSAEITPGVAR